MMYNNDFFSKKILKSISAFTSYSLYYLNVNRSDSKKNLTVNKVYNIIKKLNFVYVLSIKFILLFIYFLSFVLFFKRIDKVDQKKLSKMFKTLRKFFPFSQFFKFLSVFILYIYFDNEVE